MTMLRQGNVPADSAQPENKLIQENRSSSEGSFFRNEGVPPKFLCCVAQKEEPKMEDWTDLLKHAERLSILAQEFEASVSTVVTEDWYESKKDSLIDEGEKLREQIEKINDILLF